MKKQVLIEANGEITSGYTTSKVAVGEVATITAQDENGATFEATGKVIEIIEL